MTHQLSYACDDVFARIKKNGVLLLDADFSMPTQSRSIEVRTGTTDKLLEMLSCSAATCDQTIQALIPESTDGAVWSDNATTHRKRSTMAGLAAAGSFTEIPKHVCSTATTGTGKRYLPEVFLLVAINAGVPKANHATNFVTQSCKEMGLET